MKALFLVMMALSSQLVSAQDVQDADIETVRETVWEISKNFDAAVEGILKTTTDRIESKKENKRIALKKAVLELVHLTFDVQQKLQPLSTTAASDRYVDRSFQEISEKNKSLNHALFDIGLSYIPRKYAKYDNAPTRAGEAELRDNKAGEAYEYTDGKVEKFLCSGARGEYGPMACSFNPIVLGARAGGALVSSPFAGISYVFDAARMGLFAHATTVQADESMKQFYISE